MEWAKRRRVMVDRIMRCQYKRMEHGVWDNISSEAKAFVASLLQLDPKRRPTAAQALKSNWMKKKFTSEQVDEERGDDGNSLRRRQLQTLATALVAYKMPYDDIEAMRALFQEYDRDKSGLITYGNFCNALTETNQFTKEELERKFSEIFVSKF